MIKTFLVLAVALFITGTAEAGMLMPQEPNHAPTQAPSQETNSVPCKVKRAQKMVVSEAACKALGGKVVKKKTLRGQ